MRWEGPLEFSTHEYTSIWRATEWDLHSNTNATLLAPFRSAIRIYRYELPWHVAFRHSHDDIQSSYNILYGAFEHFFNQHANDWAVRPCPILLRSSGLPLLMLGPHVAMCPALLASFRKGGMVIIITYTPNPAAHSVCGCTLGTQ